MSRPVSRVFLNAARSTSEKPGCRNCCGFSLPLVPGVGAVNCPGEKTPFRYAVVRSVHVVAGDVRVVQVVAVGVVVASGRERRRREDRHRVARLLDVDDADAPALGQDAHDAMAVVHARKHVRQRGRESIRHVPRRRPVELMRVDRRRVVAGIVLRARSRVGDVEERASRHVP